MIFQAVNRADPGFQVRGGAHKKNRAERREARNFFGVFRVKKITILRKKIIFFPALGGRGTPLVNLCSMIKIRYLTCFPLLTSSVVGDMRKHHNVPHISDSVPTNENHVLETVSFKYLLICFSYECYDQSY